MSFFRKFRGLGPIFKDWLNVFASVGGLIVAIVSLWVTAQISGIQDYFQSEIIRRNQELNEISQYKIKIDETAEARLQKIEELQKISDQLSTYVARAQLQLFDVNKNLNSAERNLIYAQDTIVKKDLLSEKLNTDISTKNRKIELLDRKNLYSLLSFRGALPLLNEKEGKAVENGVDVYRGIVDIAVGEVSPDLAKYISGFRANAEITCDFIKQYSNKIPSRKNYPLMPPVKGQTVLEGGKLMYRFTKSEFESYQKNDEQHKIDVDKVIQFNDLLSKYSSEVDKYFLSAINNCTCKALATEKISASEICEYNDNDPKMPIRPRELDEN